MPTFTSFKSCLLLLFLGTIVKPAFAQQPVISSFTPVTAPVGATITVAGNNFSTTLSNNIVYFGGAKAKVLTASSSSLTVKVPSGASYQPITVTNTANGLTGYSAKRFLTTFPGGDNTITANAFDNPQGFSVGVSPNRVAIGDMDGDGRPDAAAICDPGGSGFTVSLLRNTTTYGKLSFAPKIDTVFWGFTGNSIVLADMDGDGLLDLLTGSSQYLYAWRNTSTPGNIDFSDVFTIHDGIAAPTASLQVGDMDGDGKPDIVFMNGDALCLLKNTSTKGKITFAPFQVIRPAGPWGWSGFLNIGDLDGDARPDIATIGRTVDTLLILRNTSTGSNVSFDSSKFYTRENTGSGGMCMSDIDGDGTLDITLAQQDDESVYVYTNKSTPGKILITPFTGKGAMYFVSEVTSGDINGDGKPDLLANRPSFYHMAILQNNSKPCGGSLAAMVELDLHIHGFSIVDLNGDGKPDLVGAAVGSNTVTVMKNKMGQQITACANSAISIPSSHTGTSYQWQQSTGGAYANINDNSSFVGTSSAALQISNVPASWNGYSFRCIVDTDTSNAFSLVVNLSMVPSVTISHCPSVICQGTTRVLLTATAVNGGASPLYQWQDSTDQTGWKNIDTATSESLDYTVTHMGKVRCLLTSAFSCVAPATDTSNIITTQVIPLATSSISITGNTAIQINWTTTLTATAVDPGGSFIWRQWQDSTDQAGWKDITNATFATLRYAPSKIGNRVRCLLKSTAPCPTTAIIISNVLTFTGDVPTAVSNLTGAGYSIVIYPNPANNYLYLDSLKLSDNWQWIEIVGSDGKNTGLFLSLKGLSRSQLDISRLPRGQYFMILQRKEGRRFYYKFIKQ